MCFCMCQYFALYFGFHCLSYSIQSQLSDSADRPFVCSTVVRVRSFTVPRFLCSEEKQCISVQVDLYYSCCFALSASFCVFASHCSFSPTSLPPSLSLYTGPSFDILYICFCLLISLHVRARFETDIVTL